MYGGGDKVTGQSFQEETDLEGFFKRGEGRVRRGVS
jgi:hypothetical protein